MSNLIFYDDKNNKDSMYRTINLYCFHDSSLSWKAKGLLCYLMTRPGKWKIWNNAIRKCSIDGETSVRSGINELSQSGYVHKGKIYIDGKIKHWIHVVFSEPCNSISLKTQANIERHFHGKLSIKKLFVENVHVEGQGYSNKIDRKNMKSSFKKQKKIDVSHETSPTKKVLTPCKGIKETQQKRISTKLELHPFATKAISLWNTLPNITTHKKPSKVWLNIIKYLNILKSGKLYKKRFDAEFLKKYNIRENILKHKFSKQEIIITLKKVSEWCQQGFLIRDKGFPTSLPNAIYNPYSFYQSVFLIACVNDLKPAIQKIENKFPETTEYFQKRINIILNDEKLNLLCKNLNLLFDYHKKYILGKTSRYHINRLFGDFKSMCITFINWLVDNDKNRNLDKNYKYSVYVFKPDSIVFERFIKYYEKSLNCNFSPSFNRF